MITSYGYGLGKDETKKPEPAKKPAAKKTKKTKKGDKKNDSYFSVASDFVFSYDDNYIRADRPQG